MFGQENGLIFRDLCIDPHKAPKSKSVLFTHAHADHVKLSKSPSFFGTKATNDIIKKRYNAQGSKLSDIDFGAKNDFDSFSLELFPNGHILGSSQARIVSDGNVGVVTSDFRLKDSVFFKGAEPLKADTLVLETTFADPKYSFPKNTDVVSDMVSWIEKNAKSGLVLLSGYSLGKAQELNYIANQAGFEPVVHDSIFDMNKIYENHGVNVGKFSKLDHNLKDFSVIIMPPQLVDKNLFATLEHFDKRKLSSAVVTGWEHRGSFDKVFPLSNHADFNDLIEYVKLSDPKLVLTDHGFCESFARKLNRLGYNAKPLKHYKQRVLSEY
jgi:Cft2 family RNA processing exonuclease